MTISAGAFILPRLVLTNMALLPPHFNKKKPGPYTPILPLYLDRNLYSVYFSNHLAHFGVLPMSAAIISVGDEILSGRTQDTNFPFLARQLHLLGITVDAHLTVPDSCPQLTDALAARCKTCRLVLITGGLGPTNDDITRFALSDVLASPLHLHQAALQQIEALFARLNRPMTQVNRVQAMIPASADIIENSCGTASGIRAHLGDTHIFALPGVPHEMRTMFTDHVAPAITALGLAQASLAVTYLHCCGTGESNIFTLIEDLMDRPGNPLVGITVQDGIVTISVTASADSVQAARLLLDQKNRLLEARLGEFLFGRDDQTLPQVVGDLFIRKNQTLALAESCTGGLIAKLLTDVPGSSGFFLADLVTYSNQAKIDLLDVPQEILVQHGAVSSACARAMAAGAISHTHADWSLSVTGIVGPDGGTSDKPVGLVYIALAKNTPQNEPQLLDVKELRFTGTRSHIRSRVAVAALDLLRHALRGQFS